VRDGRIVIIGGRARSTGREAIRDVTEYDPRRNQWLALSPLPEGRMAPIAASIGARVMVTAGGRNSALMFVNSTGVHAASIKGDAPADLERYVYQVQFGPDEATRQQLIASLSERDRPGWTMKSTSY